MTLRPLSPERTSSRPESSEGKLDGSTELTSALSGKSASTNGGAKSNNLFSLNNFLVKPADTSSKLDAHRANAPLAGNTNSAGSGSTSEFANLEPSRFSGFTTESATEPNRSTSMTPRPTSDLWPFNGSQPAKSLDPKPVSTKPTSGSSSGLFGPGGFGSTQMTFGSSGRLSSGQNSTPQPGGAKDTPGRPVGPTSSTTRLGGRFGGSSNSTFDFGAPMEDSVTSSGSGFFGTNASKKVDEKSN
ncbi:hypothetical protein K469DRAFT_704246 [Zopfia rhizophila CBS 207.26]|uniref:Uncharacterized protein n=1 Tax=Zopfia rhizophila CBS 207.26 TaxID=1314779 RepID=A0A6A6E7Q5_9PEZI|nr:hypothetical protein K469DRAFT_704246 [Zopfia rhizophila CBS 207.26]